MTPDDAETLAIEAISFTAADAALLNRFLAISGIRVDQIREAARNRGFLAGVLQFIAAHEPTLIAFAAYAGVKPESIVTALRRLPNGDENYDMST